MADPVKPQAPAQYVSTGKPDNPRTAQDESRVRVAPAPAGPVVPLIPKTAQQLKDEKYVKEHAVLVPGDVGFRHDGIYTQPPLTTAVSVEAKKAQEAAARVSAEVANKIERAKRKAVVTEAKKVEAAAIAAEKAVVARVTAEISTATAAAVAASQRPSVTVPVAATVVTQRPKA